MTDADLAAALADAGQGKKYTGFPLVPRLAGHVERLAAEVGRLSQALGDEIAGGDEAAKSYFALEKERDRLRELLRPAAEIAKRFVGWNDGEVVWVPMRIRDCRAAADELRGP